MSWKDTLFRFRGRISRKPFWLGNLAVLAVTQIAAALVLGLFFVLSYKQSGQGPAAPSSLLSNLIGWGILVPAVVFAFWCSTALFVKRLHDRDKTGWWMLVYYFAAVLAQIADRLNPEPTLLSTVLILLGLAVVIYFFIELGFLRGTRGPNRFGPDPLGGALAATTL